MLAEAGVAGACGAVLEDGGAAGGTLSIIVLLAPVFGSRVTVVVVIQPVSGSVKTVVVLVGGPPGWVRATDSPILLSVTGILQESRWLHSGFWTYHCFHSREGQTQQAPRVVQPLRLGLGHEQVCLSHRAE